MEDKSLLSSDSEDSADEDFTQVNATTKFKQAAWNEDEVSNLPKIYLSFGVLCCDL
jgi:hypothetical protein